MPTPTSAADDDAKKKARLARFAAPGSKTDPAEEDKKKARALRCVFLANICFSHFIYELCVIGILLGFCVLCSQVFRCIIKTFVSSQFRD